VQYFALNGTILLSAFALDLIFGDPRWLPHPVRGIGWTIQRTEMVLRRFAITPLAEKAAGIFLVVLIVSLVSFLSHFLIITSSRISLSFGFALSVLLSYTTLAARDLGNAAKGVLRHLDAGEIAQARTGLSMIVGRDTDDLDDQEIARAVVETVAENTSDGVIAPLFYLAIGGPVLALAYKAVNTLDSMIGYRNERYINFGWAAARLDDIANFIPARITAVLICLATEILRGVNAIGSRSPIPSPFRGEAVSELRTPSSARISPWHIMLRDGNKHPSPNSGYPEAAMAGALGIRLGGPATYAGIPSFKPFIGEAINRLDEKHIEKSVNLMYCTTSFAVLGAAAIMFLI
jgi:adenosylcobinamide-phosphate synthase